MHLVPVVCYINALSAYRNFSVMESKCKQTNSYL